MPHALRMPAKTPLTSDKIDEPAACATSSATRPFHFVHTASVVTRTRNVSEYMLVLALCLVVYFTEPPRPTQPPTLSGTGYDYRPKCGDALRLGVKAGWLISYVDKHVGDMYSYAIPS